MLEMKHMNCVAGSCPPVTFSILFPNISWWICSCPRPSQRGEFVSEIRIRISLSNHTYLHSVSWLCHIGLSIWLDSHCEYIKHCILYPSMESHCDHTWRFTPLTSSIYLPMSTIKQRLTIAQMLHVWKVYLHLGHFWGKCRWINVGEYYITYMEHLGRVMFTVPTDSNRKPGPHPAPPYPDAGAKTWSWGARDDGWCCPAVNVRVNPF